MATSSSILQKLQGIPSIRGLTLLVPVFSDALNSFLDSAPPNFAILCFGSLDTGFSNIPSFAAAVKHRRRVNFLTLMLPCSSFSLELLQSFPPKSRLIFAFRRENFASNMMIVWRKCSALLRSSRPSTYSTSVMSNRCLLFMN